MHTVGAVVDGFELTESGDWVRRSPTAGSPYRLGDVVDGHMLDADLTWVPLRRRPSEPYVPGDVVDDHVLTPEGDWVPLASRVRSRVEAGARRRPTPAAAPGAGAERRPEQTAAQRAATRATEHRLARERAATERRDAVQSASAEQRAVDYRAATERATADRAAAREAAASAPAGQDAPARRTYRVGDVVNGHVLLPDHRWVPVPGRPGSGQQPAARPVGPTPGASRAAAPQAPRRAGVNPFVPLLVLGFVVLQVLRACS